MHEYEDYNFDNLEDHKLYANDNYFKKGNNIHFYTNKKKDDQLQILHLIVYQKNIDEFIINENEHVKHQLFLEYMNQYNKEKQLILNANTKTEIKKKPIVNANAITKKKKPKPQKIIKQESEEEY